MESEEGFNEANEANEANEVDEADEADEADGAHGANGANETPIESVSEHDAAVLGMRFLVLKVEEGR